MSKFKVGDKFLVVGDGHFTLKDGDIVELYKDDGSDIKYYETLDGRVVAVGDSRLKPLATANTLQVGQTYTSENGNEWECIFIRDGKAWMIHPNAADTGESAYAFDIDGTASWAGGHGAAWYNIKWGPKRDTVKTRFSVGMANKYALDGVDNHVANITFDLIDGTPDWTTAKVTPCD